MPTRYPLTNRDESDEMSHPQPTPQDDDQANAVKVIADAIRSNLGSGKYWVAPRIAEALKSAGYELVSQVGTVHESPDSWSHITGGPYTPAATDNQVINPDLIESIAQWLGERESTHLWPEIHESDKACYRDAARDLITKVKFSLVASAVSLNPEERKVARAMLAAEDTAKRARIAEANLVEAYAGRAAANAGQEAGKAFAAGLEEIAPGASSAAEMGRKIAERNIAASQEAGNGFAAALEATGILHGLPGLADDLIRLVAELAPRPWKLTNVSGAANVVAVQLPEPDEHDCWYIEGTNDWLVHTGSNGTGVFFETSVDLYEFVAGHARNLAAALLAAAAKVEAGE